MCCDFVVIGKNGELISVGRAMEWGKFQMRCELKYNPAGMKLNTRREKLLKEIDSSDDSKDELLGFCYISKYGYFFATSDKGDGTLPQVAVDGINDQGLTCDSLAFKSCKYDDYDEVKEKEHADDNAIYSCKLSHYLLGMFSTVDQIKKFFENGIRPDADNLDDDNLDDEKKNNNDDNANIPFVYSAAGKPEEPFVIFHLQLFDAKGNGIIIEFLEDFGLQIYDSIGIMTNAPEYSWHLNNIKLYQHLDSYTNLELRKKSLIFENSAAMIGLPGDWSSPSRFIRLYINNKFANEPTTGDELVNTTGHLLNMMTIPKGLVVVEKDEEIEDINEYTQWISIKVIKCDDYNKNGYYLRLYNDITTWHHYTFDDVKKFNDETTTQIIFPNSKSDHN